MFVRRVFRIHLKKIFPERRCQVNEGLSFGFLKMSGGRFNCVFAISVQSKKEETAEEGQSGWKLFCAAGRRFAVSLRCSRAAHKSIFLDNSCFSALASAH